MDTTPKATQGSAPAAQAAYLIERLLQFALKRRLIEGLDVYAARNGLLDLFGIAEPYAGEVEEAPAESPVGILEGLLDYAAQSGLLEENNTTLRDLLDARIMGHLMPRQSEVVGRFWSKARTEGVEQATDEFYRLCIDSNYIRMDRIEKNLYWLAPTEYGALEMTVNLSKPEKDPKEIAMLKNAPQSHYPKCLLCVENVGYAGRLNHPARQNHRVIPLELNGEPWFFQYSPYVYYNEHSIIFDKQHRPMKISRGTFERLLDFVDQFPHYFVGSNADLPIVGGSILNHDHFQGGRHKFPMEIAPVEESFTHPEYPGVKLGIVNWPMSVLRIQSHHRELVLKLAGTILDTWREYSDPSQEVLAYTEQDGARTPHNTVTPIARNNANGEYELDLVLRNNRTSAEHPDGIFHPHQELHHIKKENIGLIEVMGLAVLPGRLKDELELAAKLFTGGMPMDGSITEDASHPLHKHAAWLSGMMEEHGTSLTGEEAERLLKEAVGRKFSDVLRDAGVYKRDEHGRQGFRAYLKSIGFE
ncbi:UDP-glucose--hexose-1-phosphate uridylyltransferase [Paenibacillus mucilaginosus]|uniref:Galactose-1-phosphate uridylyltransferase n=3 Tax=Paenibacillus mucilaginosus TaxID=61624 RepID=H6NBM3_9BACL|nr:UDP-glucose--hexose-1-phosphate uridylyltransferase [Paenibacillus mucilaginosus]AEI46174.1 GalT [Paenibacillus mucilaginosus KNP414]AFC33792.1 GalT [Paenibacillus mucilaginosus 3016]AFH66122.2 galactose-1-phosphate uridylyltransferase [Paenibacillus mucilaginosus K02]MCG7213694.1 UDP-glucose--hexose-1-phosphate uridylyltransferase [Paenibacillus mucilaginosus]WDM27502.1 UDP-glucose--hexose-1-phosphate uridylyltransferase [Paenibacillus mucilaginosus]